MEASSLSSPQKLPARACRDSQNLALQNEPTLLHQGKVHHLKCGNLSTVSSVYGFKLIPSQFSSFRAYLRASVSSEMWQRHRRLGPHSSEVENRGYHRATAVFFWF